MKSRFKKMNVPFCMVSNKAAQDETLSIEARGLLALLSSFPDDWNFQIPDLRKRCGVGIQKLQKMMKELSAAGYLE